MIIGILSDSHGQVQRLAAALAEFENWSVEALVHCGDIGRACVRPLTDCRYPIYLALGNADRNINWLTAGRRRRRRMVIDRQVVEVPIAPDVYLAACHGDDQRLVEELVASQAFPYVCHGHTHRMRDERYGKVRVINPGSLFYPRGYEHHTVAVLDTEADTLEHIELP